MADINFLNSIPLGKIFRFQDSKAALITPISFPGQNAERTKGVDTLGIIAYYNISGRMVGNFDTIQGYIYLIKLIADGAQFSSVKLQTPFINSKYYNGSSSVRVQGNIGANTADAGSDDSLIDTGAAFEDWNITTNDYVKNLVTGAVSGIDSIDSQWVITCTDSIFPETAPFTSKGYAVTATINVKVLSFEVVWNLPGLNYVDYQLSVMQVT